MSISAGFTADEIREFVLEYQALPQGRKGPWLSARGVPYERLRRWRAAVFEGDLDLNELTGSPKKIRALPPDLQGPVVESIAHAVDLVYLTSVPMAALVVLVAWRVRELPLRTSSPMAEARAAAAPGE